MPTGVEVIDNWSREIFLWTFDYSFISALLIATPITFWIVLGLMYILTTSAYRPDTNKETFKVLSVYILIPIVYLYIVGYTGHLITK